MGVARSVGVQCVPVCHPRGDSRLHLLLLLLHEVPQSNGDVSQAPSEGCNPDTTSDPVYAARALSSASCGYLALLHARAHA
eukprot:COSAG05_NODE_168_length_15164_cov_8.323734_8_plen_81_part_00